jgi:hypothetical protein
MEDFITGRKKFRLRDSTLLRRGDEKRHSFVFEQTLSVGDDTMNGMPEWVHTAYNTMLKSANRQKKIVFDERIENVAIDFFATPKSRTRIFTTVIGATLGKFTVERTGKEDNVDVTLIFTCIFPGRKEIHDWTWDHKKADFFASFEPQQSDIFQEAVPNGEGEDVEEEEDDSEEDEEEDEEGNEILASAKARIAERELKLM